MTATTPARLITAAAIFLLAGPGGAQEATEPAPMAASELAQVRFRQERYAEAAAFARRALVGNEADPDLWALLGSSLFLADDPRGAIRAWNRIDEPRVDQVRVEGLTRVSEDLATSAIGLRAPDLLTLSALARAERRIEELPTLKNATVTFQPADGGKADVVATAGEVPLSDPWRFLVLRLGIKGAFRREMSLRLNGLTGHGESLDLGWRFEENRPAVWLSVDVPRLAGVSGVVSLQGLWDRQTYRPRGTGAAPPTVEDRRRAALAWSHWISAVARVEAGFAVDRFPGRGAFASSKFGLELRGAQNRLALVAEVESWGAASTPGFSELGGALAFRSRALPGRFLVSARVDGRRATGASPLAVWPGAGTGPSRPFLLRASPLLDQGEMIGEGFGRSLVGATVEVELKIAERGEARLGLAAFGDGVRVWDPPFRSGRIPNLFAVGFGLRVRGLARTGFRADVAIRPGQRDLVFSGGVIRRWPR